MIKILTCIRIVVNIFESGVSTMKLTFKGGIHPYEGKELTMDKDVIEYVDRKSVV